MPVILILALLMGACPSCYPHLGPLACHSQRPGHLRSDWTYDLSRYDGQRRWHQYCSWDSCIAKSLSTCHGGNTYDLGELQSFLCRACLRPSQTRRHTSGPSYRKKNENIYLFLPRTLWGGLVSAWRLETDRVRNRKLTWTLKDRRVRYTFVYGLLIAAIFFNFGLLGVGVFVGQSMMAVLLLEVINYVEHYGLSRKQLENGRYERVLPKHS